MNHLQRSSFKISARMMGAGKAKKRLASEMDSVLRNSVQKSGPVKSFLKYFSPAKGLPNTHSRIVSPLKGLKSVNAIYRPVIGR